jgi:hypothetical protein
MTMLVMTMVLAAAATTMLMVLLLMMIGAMVTEEYDYRPCCKVQVSYSIDLRNLLQLMASS